MTFAELSALPLYALFASAAKHAMDSAVFCRREAGKQSSYWEAESYHRISERWRSAAWDHLAAAREAKRRAAIWLASSPPRPTNG